MKAARSLAGVDFIVDSGALDSFKTHFSHVDLGA